MVFLVEPKFKIGDKVYIDDLKEIRGLVVEICIRQGSSCANKDYIFYKVEWFHNGNIVSYFFEQWRLSY